MKKPFDYVLKKEGGKVGNEKKKKKKERSKRIHKLPGIIIAWNTEYEIDFIFDPSF